MAKEFYGGPACDHNVPVEHFEATLQECIRSKEYSRTLMLEDETGVVGYFLIGITWSNEAGGITIWLDELFFKSSSRGKGYGTPVSYTHLDVYKRQEQVKPWGYLGDMSQAVYEHAHANGYSVVREIGGHGIGLEFHEDPWVGYIGKAGTGMLLVPGMMFTIEPMINICLLYTSQR